MPYFPLYDNVRRQRTAWVTYAILLANVLVFAHSVSLDDAGRRRLAFQRGFVPARVAQLQTGRPLPVVVERPGFAVRQQIGVLAPDRNEIVSSWLSCMFLHAGWLHIVGNMWFLWVFARSVEDRLGHVWFAVFYLLVGLLATACHWFDEPANVMPMIGASGAVAGVLGAYAVLFPRARVKTLLFLVVFFTIFDLPAIAVLGVWFFVQFAGAHKADLGIGGGVAWWAHIGGFMVGMGLMLAFTSPTDDPETDGSDDDDPETDDPETDDSDDDDSDDDDSDDDKKQFDDETSADSTDSIKDYS
jgi:membrane associated rhomboid family serine protease